MLKILQSKKDIVLIILMIITAALITFAGVYYKQNFLRIMPLYVSLIISTLQSRINRFASLLGGINSIVYGLVYIYYNLYASAISAFLFSFPVQILTFIRWNKNKWERSTVLRKMTLKQRLLLLLGFVFLLVAMCVVLPMIGSEYVFLDSLSTLMGTVCCFLTMLAFVEYTFLMVINGIIAILLYISMLGDTPETATYLIYSVYCLLCTVIALFHAKKIYSKQQEQKVSL